MNIRTTISVGVAAFLLVACLPSVNPFYRAQDVTLDPALPGEWIEGDETWRFERLADEDAYRVTFLDGRESDGRESGSMKATLFTLDDHRYLDLIAENVEFAEGQSDLIEFSVFPGHIVMHVAEIGPQLRLALMDLDFMEQFLEANPNDLDQIPYEDRNLLTGNTRELQRFLKKYVDGGELFPESEYSEMTRVD
jgi:hypothetical protein